ncbi:MAG TPA: DUF1996 domain-containing protein [Gaiellaceae bacterium]|nr:DUF1996 domain-containing protein [Gaiellaceae bacterium]
MKRYAVVAATTLLGVVGIVAAAGAASGFGGGDSGRVVRAAKRIGPNHDFKRVTSLRRLRGVNFVSMCVFSHRNTDDPIVYPGQPGRSHDHTFIGNDTTNAFSSVATMRGGTSSCRRAGDTAAYWAPTLVGPGGQAIQPVVATVYYRRHTLTPLQAFPDGFRMIAGNARATSAQGLTVTSWNCGPQAGVRPQATVPTCPDADRRGLALHVQFPDCWDGINLDSPDHQSHMAYSTRGRCPAPHRVALPAIQLNLRYPSAGGTGLVLASGGQFSGHADFFNAWNPQELQRLVNRCLNGLRHCQNRG